MKQIYYNSNDKEAMLQITTTLGMGDLTIAVADKYLNWNNIYLNSKQTEDLLKFLNEKVMK